MFDKLPNVKTFMTWDWSQIEPFFDDLNKRDLNAETLETFMKDWTRLLEVAYERYTRHMVATTQNTADEEAEEALNNFLDSIYPQLQSADQQLKEKLLATGLEPENFSVQMRDMRSDAALFREENLPLMAELQKLGNEYDKIAGAQTVEWEGEERTLSQMLPLLQDDDRDTREKAWRLMMRRTLQDREVLNDLWQSLLELRLEIAENADEPDFRSYQWKTMYRFDYTPDDCKQFHAAIEAVVVPAVERMHERRRQRMGVEALRPWDLDVDPLKRPPLRPFEDVAELEAVSEAIFQRVDPQLGAYFGIMRRDNLLDLGNRKNKAPGGYCTNFDAERKPFVFMNAVGLHDDVQTLLHEAGHCFHVFETADLPYLQQTYYTAEFAEVASMAMELIAAPYLSQDKGGFYTEADAARARVEHLEGIIGFWPYMAVVDAFQHWVYENPDDAMNPDNCDAQWSALWERFMRGVDWTGLEDEKVTGWHRKLHIFQIPFYYVDYGMAQLAAVQVWKRSLDDQAGAVKQYREALALGATRPLPQLFEAAGAKFAFDPDTMREAVTLVEGTIEALES